MVKSMGSENSTEKTGSVTAWMTTATPFLATVIIPVVLAFITQIYAASIKEKEVATDMVKLAVDIMKQKPTDDNLGLRAWATEVLEHYSGVDFSKDKRSDVINKSQLLSEFSSSISSDQLVFEILLELDQLDFNMGNIEEVKVGELNDYQKLSSEKEVKAKAISLAQKITGEFLKDPFVQKKTEKRIVVIASEIADILSNQNNTVGMIILVFDENFIIELKETQQPMR